MFATIVSSDCWCAFLEVLFASLSTIQAQAPQLCFQPIFAHTNQFYSFVPKCICGILFLHP